MESAAVIRCIYNVLAWGCRHMLLCFASQHSAKRQIAHAASTPLFPCNPSMSVFGKQFVWVVCSQGFKA